MDKAMDYNKNIGGLLWIGQSETNDNLFNQQNIKFAHFAAVTLKC